MNYLVTGAAGFIGAAVAKMLIEKGDNVTTIDNLSTGKRENIPKGVNLILGDVGNREIIQKLSNQRFDAIIHIAGQSSGEISFENPEYDLNTNTLSTLLLLKFADENGCKKFIYASSMAVYGDIEEGYATENSATIPKSFYAVGKLASENYMRIFSNNGLQCTALRLFNVYGVGQNMDNLKQGMASIYLAQAIKYKHIVIKGSGDRFRDFVYIDDVVSAVDLVLSSDADGFDVYNVSNKSKVFVSEIIDIIENHIDGVDHEYIGGTPGDQHGVFGDNRKLKKLGWNPTVSFAEGMNKMICWACNGGVHE